MPKVELKQKIYKRTNGKCLLSGEKLPANVKLYDTHRQIPKRKGGTYTGGNTLIANPVRHMVEHGTLRLRTAELGELKKLVDARQQAIKFRNKVANQILAYKRRTDQLNTETVEMLERQTKEGENLIKSLSKQVEKAVKILAKVDPLVKSAMGVKSVGFMTVAICVSYIDLEKARHASSLWSYAGLHKASRERYEKNISGGGNKTLRCALYTMGESQVKGKGAYRDVYDRIKSRLEVSEKIVISRNTQGKEVKVMWKDTKPCHRHGAAIRAVMKHFLADYWFVGRTLSGLETNPIYAEAILGMSHKTISPNERGWKY